MHFCTDGEVNVHNKEAPNEHNRICSQRSTWDVISSSEDFLDNGNSLNSARDISDVTPNFNVLQVKNQTHKTVLVLDSSGSMAADVSKTV